MTSGLVVLGVDPGLTRCGLAAVAGPSARPRLLATECVRTDPGLALEQRLLALHDAILAAVSAHRPDAVAVERVLFSANVRTAMATGQAAGVALLAAAAAAVPVVAYSPTDVKLTVTGSGATDKDGVARLVAAQMGLSAPPTPADVADAIAVALTHLARSRLALAAARTGAGEALAAAERSARTRSRGGWEAVLADRLSPPGGPARTAPPGGPARTAPPAGPARTPR